MLAAAAHLEGGDVIQVTLDDMDVRGTFSQGQELSRVLRVARDGEYGVGFVLALRKD